MFKKTLTIVALMAVTAPAFAQEPQSPQETAILMRAASYQIELSKVSPVKGAMMETVLKQIAPTDLKATAVNTSDIANYIEAADSAILAELKKSQVDTIFSERKLVEQFKSLQNDRASLKNFVTVLNVYRDMVEAGSKPGQVTLMKAVKEFRLKQVPGSSAAELTDYYLALKKVCPFFMEPAQRNANRRESLK